MEKIKDTILPGLRDGNRIHTFDYTLHCNLRQQKIVLLEKCDHIDMLGILVLNKFLCLLFCFGVFPLPLPFPFFSFSIL